MPSSLLRRILQFVAALGIIACITVFYYKVLPVNATTVALTFILAILVVSTLWGMTVSVPLSVVAMFAFNLQSIDVCEATLRQIICKTEGAKLIIRHISPEGEP